MGTCTVPTIIPRVDHDNEGPKGPHTGKAAAIKTVMLHTLPPQKNQAIIPVYQLDASAIKSLLAQDTSESSEGSDRGVAQEDKKDDRGSYFKVSEGEIYRMRNMCGL